MRLRWYGQSAFLLTGGMRVLIDPFGELEGLAERGVRFDYPAIGPVEVDVLLVTHEHSDHNGVEVATGSPAVVRSLAGRHESPLGEVVAVASEHDDAAGTVRGPNTMLCFSLDGLRFCHFGDFGQSELRPAQAQAIGEVDVLFLPVGGGPTLDGEGAAEVAQQLRPRLVVPMHYRTEALNFLDPADGFEQAFGGSVEHLDSSEVELEPLLGTRERPTAALIAPPRA